MSYSDEDKLVFKIDRDYKTYLRKIIKERISMYPGIPADWEDIYIMFLKDSKQHVDNYDPAKGIPFHIFLGRMCKFFTMNECRRLSTQKFKVLNNSVPLDNLFSLEDPSTRVSVPVDLSVFSKVENSIYHLYFIKEKRMIDVSKDLEISIHKVRTAIKSIRLKLLSQLRN